MNLNNLKIKVCGMRDAENISQLVQLPINYIGFIFFHKSPRFVGEDFDPAITRQVPASIKKTGVFVNASEEYVSEKIEKYSLDAVQLHGSESPEYCSKFIDRAEVVKAFGIDETFDFTRLDAYADACNYFLFDTKSKQHGGTGKKFEWSVLDKYNGSKPLFMSGGIGPGDAGESSVLSKLPVYALDLNSKFETAPAMKNIEELAAFISEL